MDEQHRQNKLPGIKKFKPGIAWFFIVLVLVCTPGPDLPEVGDWFGEISADKFIHCGIFGMLAFLFMYPAGGAPVSNKIKLQWFLKIALSTCVFGFITELLQLFYIPGRSYSLVDCLADMLGASLAFASAWYWYIKRKGTLSA